MRASEIATATAALLRTKYNLLCGLFVSLGILVVLLAIFSSSVFICLVPFVLFGFLGVLVRCPVCETPIGYFHDDIFPLDTPGRCRSCGRIITSQPDRDCFSA